METQIKQLADIVFTPNQDNGVVTWEELFTQICLDYMITSRMLWIKLEAYELGL